MLLVANDFTDCTYLVVMYKMSDESEVTIEVVK